jgi:hypothetical protein
MELKWENFLNYLSPSVMHFKVLSVEQKEYFPDKDFLEKHIAP